MTVSDFMQRYGADWKIFYESSLGKALVETLEGMPMQPSCDPTEHQAMYRLGGIAGYEACLVNMLKLTLLPVKYVQPEANYGVKPKEPAEPGSPSQ